MKGGLPRQGLAKDAIWRIMPRRFFKRDIVPSGRRTMSAIFHMDVGAARFRRLAAGQPKCWRGEKQELMANERKRVRERERASGRAGRPSQTPWPQPLVQIADPFSLSLSGQAPGILLHMLLSCRTSARRLQHLWVSVFVFCLFVCFVFSSHVNTCKQCQKSPYID